MMKRINKNGRLAQLIVDLKQLAIEQDVKLWKRIATDLEKPTRQRREINVYKIDQNSKDNDFVIVPGKVLGMGELTHKVNVAALAFSTDAKEKIAAQGSVLTIEELMKKNPKASKVKVLG